MSGGAGRGQPMSGGAGRGQAVRRGGRWRGGARPRRGGARRAVRLPRCGTAAPGICRQSMTAGPGHPQLPSLGTPRRSPRSPGIAAAPQAAGPSPWLCPCSSVFSPPLQTGPAPSRARVIKSFKVPSGHLLWCCGLTFLPRQCAPIDSRPAVHSLPSLTCPESSSPGSP